jgi:shikimate dehydrogenase
MLVGLIGKNILQSLSPALHEDAFAARGVVGLYHLMDANPPRERSLAELLAAVRLAGFAGVNITFPFKEAVIPLLDEVSKEASQIGAVNTVVIDPGGRTTGYNTDRSGFRAAFRETFGEASVAGKKALQLGAGGAGRAVAFALMDLGVAELSIFDLDQARAHQLCADLCGLFGASRAVAVGEPQQAASSADAIVNATFVGMTGHAGLPMPTDKIAAHHLVADVIYTPLETEFIKAAKARGARTMGGAGMCVHQAVNAFRLFTGWPPDIDRMRRTFLAAAEKREQANSVIPTGASRSEA